MVLELPREQRRAMILYDWKSAANYRESGDCLFGRQVPSYRIILNWFYGCKCEKLNVFDAYRLERPRTAVTEERIDMVRLFTEDDPHITYQHVECFLKISNIIISSQSLQIMEGWRSMGTASAHKRLKIYANSVLTKISDEGTTRGDTRRSSSY